MNRRSDVRYFTATLERGDIREIVQATGTINAVTTVQVGSQVSGTIAQLFADFNSRVSKGQVIAQIDPSIFEGNLLQARADLENARANLASARANLERMRAAAAQTKAEYERTIALTREGVMSQQQLEVAKANHESAAAQVSAAQAQVQQAQAQVTQRGAAVKVAETNLSHTTIHAPINGTVVSRNVDVGQTVAASLQAPTLFTIAQDLTKMQVYAKTDESDVGQIKVGQKATFKVDAFPRETFSGTVTQLRMNPTTVQNVVTYDTVVDFANPELKLFPGMTAYIDIPVAVANRALKIPNAALRYKPDMSAEQVQALYKQYGIDPGFGGERRRQRAGAGGEGAGTGVVAAAAPQGEAQQRRQRRGSEGQPGGGENEEAPEEERVPREPRPDIAILWKMRLDKTLEPVKVRTGITDYTSTELAQVLQGELKEGDQLVTGSTAPARPSGGLPGTQMGGPRRR